MAKRALIAMSGGVDSSVAAYLMLKQGYECVGATMKLIDSANTKDATDAKNVCTKLGIKHYIFNLEKEFEEKVIRKFITVYENGETPNPCIDCNRYIKFGALIDRADELSLQYIATGHYAKVEYDEQKGKYLLKKAADLSKDQSYVLYNLTQKELSRVQFPLGEYKKAEIRKTAQDNDFVTAEKAESEDICFVPDGKYWDFISKYTKHDYPPGDFVDINGNVLGQHLGMLRYTIGQRRGLNISAPNRLYVLDKNVKDNTVILGGKDDLPSKEAVIDDINLISGGSIEKDMRVKVKTRYNMKEVEASISEYQESKIKITFDTPQSSITPGQAAVIYLGDMVVGGGTIVRK